MFVSKLQTVVKTKLILRACTGIEPVTSRTLSKEHISKLQIFKMTVNFVSLVVSWFRKEQNYLVSQSKLFNTIVRHSIVISDGDVMSILTTINNDFELCYSLAELVALAPGKRPERRFAPLARGLDYELEISMGWNYKEVGLSLNRIMTKSSANPIGCLW